MAWKRMAKQYLATGITFGDIDKAEKEVRIALEGGVNYFDTAYVYPGNEAAAGEIIQCIGCRDQIQIATKQNISVCPW